MEPQREKKTALFVVLLLIFGAMMCCGGTVAFGAWNAKETLDELKRNPPTEVEAAPSEEEEGDEEEEVAPLDTGRAAFVEAVIDEGDAQGRNVSVDPGADEDDSEDDVFADATGAIPASPRVDAAYAQWSALDEEAQEAMVAALVKSLFEIPLPADWESARGHLVSTVRSRMVTAINVLENGPSLFQQTFADDLVELVGYQDGKHVQLVTVEDARPWGQSSDTIFAEARKNLAAASPSPQFKKVSPGLWESNFGDGNDVARLLLPETLKHTGLKGDPVVFPVRPGTVLIIGADDARVVEAAGNRIDELADDTAESTRKGWRLDVRESLFTPWAPPAGSLLEALARETEIGRSNLQKEVLDRAMARSSTDDLFTATALTLENDDDEVKTYAVWTKGITTLLPKVDYVVFHESVSDAEAKTLAAAPWSEVQKLVGAQMKPEPNLWPARWRVKTFPSAKNLERLGIDPLFKVEGD